MNRLRVKHLRNFLDVLKKKHDEVLLAKGSPVGKGWRTNALPFNTSLRKKKKFRKVTEARNRPEHKLFATLTDQVGRLMCNFIRRISSLTFIIFVNRSFGRTLTLFAAARTSVRSPTSTPNSLASSSTTATPTSGLVPSEWRYSHRN